MQTNYAAIVTSTSYKNWYPGKLGSNFQVDKVRGDLALKTISKASKLGFQVVVIDNDSSEAFIEKLNKIKVNKLITNFSGTFSDARRKGYIIASRLPNVSVITWTEPEKAALINKSLIKACEIVYNGGADILIPARSDTAFSTLPPFQEKSEKLGNLLIQKTIKKYLGHTFPFLDIFFGPKVFANRPEILNLFLTKYIYKKDTKENEITPVENWSNALTFPIISAIVKGYKVVGFEISYHHPSKQTELETSNLKFNQKRILQRNSLIKGVSDLLNFYKDPKKSVLSTSSVSSSDEIG